MPSLEEILKKTKDKSEQVKVVRKPPSIATEDRPYSFDETTIIQAIETGNKVATNGEQTGNKQATKWNQTGNNNESKKQNWQQSGNTTGNTIGNKLTTNRQQTDNKLATKAAFSELVGLQRDVIIFICHECKNSRSRITESLTLEHIAMSLKHSTGTIKTTIQRLEKKGCLLRVGFKNGRGGWSRYELPDNIYHDVLRSETDNKVVTKWQQSGNKVASQLATELVTSTPSSSSYLNLKETTTALSEEWNFDIIPYARFGFSISQIKQLASLGVVSATNVEQSLIEFSYDLDNNALPIIKTGKINFLMGLLRSCHSYVSEGFKNEQEAIISEMARRAEGKRKKLLEGKFSAWEDALSDEERKKITNKLPPQLMVLHHAHGASNLEIRKWLFNYYLQHAISE
jgi:predicted transcriptional regulator